MSNHIYILTDSNRQCLHVGTTQDLQETTKTYKELYGLFFDAGSKIFRLVYQESYPTADAATKRFEELKCYTRTQKERLIRKNNPNWVDLSLVRPLKIFKPKSTDNVFQFH